MYITDSGCPTGYFPINTKWGGTSRLTGLLPGGGLRGLGYFRPNFAMNRGNYPGRRSAMGQIEADPTTLGLGIGALALGMFLLGRKPKSRRRRRGLLRRVFS